MIENNIQYGNYIVTLIQFSELTSYLFYLFYSAEVEYVP